LKSLPSLKDCQSLLHISLENNDNLESLLESKLENCISLQYISILNNEVLQASGVPMFDDKTFPKLQEFSINWMIGECFSKVYFPKLLKFHIEWFVVQKKLMAFLLQIIIANVGHGDIPTRLHSLVVGIGQYVNLILEEI
jgi:hypothetical protein